MSASSPARQIHGPSTWRAASIARSGCTGSGSRKKPGIVQLEAENARQQATTRKSPVPPRPEPRPHPRTLSFRGPMSASVQVWRAGQWKGLPCRCAFCCVAHEGRDQVRTPAGTTGRSPRPLLKATGADPGRFCQGYSCISTRCGQRIRTCPETAAVTVDALATV